MGGGGRGRGRGRGRRGGGGGVGEKNGGGWAFIIERRIFFDDGFEDVGGFVGSIDGAVVLILWE